MSRSIDIYDEKIKFLNCAIGCIDEWHIGQLMEEKGFSSTVSVSLRDWQAANTGRGDKQGITSLIRLACGLLDCYAELNSETTATTGTNGFNREWAQFNYEIRGEKSIAAAYLIERLSYHLSKEGNYFDCEWNKGKDDEILSELRVETVALRKVLTCMNEAWPS